MKETSKNKSTKAVESNTKTLRIPGNKIIKEVESKQKNPRNIEHRESRVKKNKKIYNQKVIIKNKKISKMVIFLLIISLIANILTLYHFISFDHNKVKIVTKIKEKEVVPENIVFLGDSITHRYNLEKYYDDKKRIVNSGEDGNTTEDILDNLKERVYDYNPSKVILLIGTNDIQEKRSEEDIINNIKKISEEIKINRPQAKIYIESIYPVDIDHKKGGAEDRKNEEIESINKKLEEYCKDEKIEYINLYAKLLAEEGNIKDEYTKDGLHISDEGYEVITKELENYI